KMANENEISIPASSNNDDIFHDIVMLEETFHKKGYVEGIEQGKESGVKDGFQLGYDKGKQIGIEIGTYAGFAKTWKAILEQDEQPKEKALKTLKALIELVERFPSDPATENLFEILDKIRAKFKQACSLLGVTPIAASGGPTGLSF
ncbi:unnamed protein product, partial [Owenia fusiformis]